MERIIEIKGYSGEKGFKLAILKLKQYASLWYKNLKRTRAWEVKPKVQTWVELKKHMDRRFLPATYKKELYLKVISSEDSLQMLGQGEGECTAMTLRTSE